MKLISKVFIKEYQERGINCISKHVPGHGLSVVDSHYDLPVVKETYNYLTKNDFSLKTIFSSKKSIFHQKDQFF